MTTRAIAGAAGLLLATAPGAWALTAEQVWQDWQDYYAGLGATLTAEADTDDDRLTLTGLTVGMTMGEVGSVTRYEGEIDLVEQPDGSVRVELPETLRMVIETELPETDEDMPEPGPVVMLLDAAGAEIVGREAEDDPEGRVWTMTAERVTTTLEDVTQGQGARAVPLEMVFTGIDTTYRSGPGAGGIEMEQEGTAEGLTLSFEVDDVAQLDPEAAADADAANDAPSGSLALAYTASGLEYAGGGLMASDGKVGAMGLRQGSRFDVTFAHAGSETTLSGRSPEGDFSVEGLSASASGRIALTDAGSIIEEVASEGVEMTARVPQFPVPLTFSAGRMGGGFEMPFFVTGESAPAGLLLELRELTIDDMLWGLFDPTGQLPRDPATVVLDVDGAATLLVDLFSGDPAAIEAMDGPPGELEQLTVSELLVEAVGARLAGSGRLDFPTPDPSRPVGTLDLTLSGGFALMDRLVALGFLPAEQAGFVKGMAGAVAESTGEDELSTTIEFSETGSITAGGLPLR